METDINRDNRRIGPRALMTSRRAVRVNEREFLCPNVQRRSNLDH
jgi:hypothetical protein